MQNKGKNLGSPSSRPQTQKKSKEKEGGSFLVARSSQREKMTFLEDERKNGYECARRRKKRRDSLTLHSCNRRGELSILAIEERESFVSRNKERKMISHAGSLSYRRKFEKKGKKSGYKEIGSPKGKGKHLLFHDITRGHETPQGGEKNLLSATQVGKGDLESSSPSTPARGRILKRSGGRSNISSTGENVSPVDCVRKEGVEEKEGYPVPKKDFLPGKEEYAPSPEGKGKNCPRAFQTTGKMRKGSPTFPSPRKKRNRRYLRGERERRRECTVQVSRKKER